MNTDLLKLAYPDSNIFKIEINGDGLHRFINAMSYIPGVVAHVGYNIVKGREIENGSL